MRASAPRNCWPQQRVIILFCQCDDRHKFDTFALDFIYWLFLQARVQHKKASKHTHSLVHTIPIKGQPHLMEGVNVVIWGPFYRNLKNLLHNLDSAQEESFSKPTKCK